MGVERLFSSLNRDFNIVTNTQYPYKRITCSHFMIDFNSIVHITSAHIINNINTKRDTDSDFEKKLLDLIQKYTLDLLKYNIDSNLLEYLLICIDGVPTMAKIYEQKKRRYMGKLLTKLTDSLDVPFIWSKNNISPGTSFMKKLEEMLNSDQFRQKIQNVCKNIKGYYLSDTKSPGEGEMKILNCIRNISNNDTICVYSPDSDMILLLMLVDKPLILLRYDQQKSTIDDKTYNILPINNFKKILISYCTQRIGKNINKKNVINDIIFIFTIFGDDFLPKLETFRVDKDLFIILDYYLINYLENGNLLYYSDMWYINTNNLKKYLQKLQKNEDAFLFRNFNINKYSNYYRIDKDLFANDLIKIKLELKKIKENSSIKSIKDFKSSKINSIFKTNEFYLNFLKYLDSDKLRIFLIKNKFKNKNIQQYHNLFHHFETTKDLIFYIALYFNRTSQLPFTVKIKYNENNLELIPITYKSSENPHRFKLRNLEYNDKLMYKIDNKLDEYFNLFNPKDYFYHKYFNIYNSNLTDVTINNYYKLYFKDHTIEKVLREYFKGLNWVLNYYFNNITDTTWYYPFSKSPLLYNLVNQYENFSKILTKVNIDNFLITPLEQLLFISPINVNHKILPQLNLLVDILEPSDLQTIVKFIKDNKKIFFDLTDIFDNMLQSKRKILDCTNSIFINKCHLLILEGYVDIKNYAKIFRSYLSLKHQRKYYPNIQELICVST
uniref:XRN 5'-3' exonuclease-like protein n=1 Tax=Megaviridae environmental sample TaxID=1737588 RepID=A0A5J6VKB0_9VIRU|nr:MAG: XRN 5'-3' exonuclease-like protein [Megaviridae environmental sample]